MKPLLILLLWSASSFACSESGPKEFTLPRKVREKAEVEALTYAKGLALAQHQVGAPEGNLQWLPPYREEGPPSFSRALKSKDGYSAEFTLGTSFRTESQWDCLYCVKFLYDERDQSVSFSSVQLHHCAY